MFLCLLLAMGLSGCSITSRLPLLFGGTVEVRVSVLAAINQNSPVAVDFLIVYDAALAAKLIEMDASAWFKNKKQLLDDNKDKLEVTSWEWVPAQNVPPQKVRYRAGAAQGILFAGYFSPGAHRVAVNPRRHFRVTLGDSDFRVSQER